MILTIKHKFQRHVTAPRFLILVNLSVAALAFLQGLYVARILGASGYGYVGIIVTMAGIMSNFWDMRINDLAVRLHFKTENNPSAQTANALAAILINFALGLMILLTTILACSMLWHLFTETKPEFSWLLFQGIVSGCTLLIGTVYTLQRLTEKFFAFGLWRLFAQLMAFVLTIIILKSLPNIEGYYVALTASSVASLSVALYVLLREWKSKFALSVSTSELFEAFQNYRKEAGFIFSANFFSYSKMLSRSGDILLFGHFAGDAATGIYRLARTLSDNLNIFTDALSQYYTPSYMKRMTDGQHNRMELSAKRFFIMALGLTALILPTAYVALHFINTYFLHNSYPGLDGVTAMLMANFIWFCGVHIWLWPSILHHNKMKLAALVSTGAALIQMGLIAFFSYYMEPNPLYAAIAANIFYIIFYVPLLWWWKNHIKDMSELNILRKKEIGEYEI